MTAYLIVFAYLFDLFTLCKTPVLRNNGFQQVVCFIVIEKTLFNRNCNYI